MELTFEIEQSQQVKGNEAFRWDAFDKRPIPTPRTRQIWRSPDQIQKPDIRIITIFDSGKPLEI